MDTNAIISLLNGNKGLLTILNSASWIGISVISKLEFLSFSGITPLKISLFNKFTSKIETISLRDENEELLSCIIKIRNARQLKLPDAIIAASALFTKAVLLTDDKSFLQIEDLLTQRLNN